MGYEYVSGAILRSSVELRRIKNAKITAMRHRKWQEVRLQREQEEKKAAEEFLRRRRKERARLATYIYSSAQNVPKEACTKPQVSSQEHINKSRTMWEKEKSNPDCRESNQTFRKENADKDIIFDVCSLPTIPVKEKPCDKPLPKQYRHAGDGQRKAAATADFLQEALQERLENETATSLLIAEVTDMKARLDDLLAVPSRGHHEDRKEDGFEHENFKISYSSSDWEHDRTNTMQLMEREAAGDFPKDVQKAGKTECCLHQKYVILAKENQSANRMNCCMHNACLDHAAQSSKNESNFHLHASNIAIAAAEEKLMGSKFQSRPELKGLVLQQQSNGEKFSHKEATKASSCNHAFLSLRNQHDELGILNRVSQESCELEADKNMFACMEEDIDEKTIIAETTTGGNVLKENPSRLAKVALPNSKDKYSDAASNLSPIHKSTPVNYLHCSKVGKDNTSLCLRSRKDSAEILQFLNAENSLLSSLERLDGKLAMASTNISNSSRTSLVSAGRQSTKSAPCVIRRKPSSDAYSINSTMFFSRPSTSHTGGVSLTSRRRQNVGLTNITKDRHNRVQTCNMPQFKRCPAQPSPKHKEERKPSAGTIILHQNAEFLFS